MYDRSKGNLGFNLWTVFSDVAFGFMIIILLLFMKTLADWRDMATYAQAAKNDRDEIQGALQDAGLLAEGTDKEGKTILSTAITWTDNDKHEIHDLSNKARAGMLEFGEVLRDFLDKADTRKKEKYRYQTYTILIIGHANTVGSDTAQGIVYNYELSHKRAHSIREYLFDNVFGGESGKDKYQILATGYGDKHLIKRQNEIIGDRCIEIAFKYDEMDMISSEK